MPEVPRAARPCGDTGQPARRVDDDGWPVDVAELLDGLKEAASLCRMQMREVGGRDILERTEVGRGMIDLIQTLEGVLARRGQSRARLPETGGAAAGIEVRQDAVFCATPAAPGVADDPVSSGPEAVAKPVTLTEPFARGGDCSAGAPRRAGPEAAAPCSDGLTWKPSSSAQNGGTTVHNVVGEFDGLTDFAKPAAKTAGGKFREEASGLPVHDAELGQTISDIEDQQDPLACALGSGDERLPTRSVAAAPPPRPQPRRSGRARR